MDFLNPLINALYFADDTSVIANEINNLHFLLD